MHTEGTHTSCFECTLTSGSEIQRGRVFYYKRVPFPSSYSQVLALYLERKKSLVSLQCTLEIFTNPLYVWPFWLALGYKKQVILFYLWIVFLILLNCSLIVYTDLPFSFLPFFFSFLFLFFLQAKIEGSPRATWTVSLPFILYVDNNVEFRKI